MSLSRVSSYITNDEKVAKWYFEQVVTYIYFSQSNNELQSCKMIDVIQLDISLQKN